MEINYELRAEDFFQLGKEIGKNRKQPQPLFIILVITYLLFIFADIIYVFASGSFKGWDIKNIFFNLFARTLVMFIVIFFTLGIIKLITRKKEAELKKEPSNGILCAHRIVINENELLEITDINTSRYAWKAIGEIKETESFVLINVLMSSSYIIPKRYFQNKADIKEFIETSDYYRQNSQNNFQLSHIIEYEKSLE